MKENINLNGNNLLWFCNEDDNDIIFPAKAIITDKDYYDELMNRLKRISTFVIKENTILKNNPSLTSDEHVIYYTNGIAAVYGEEYEYNHSISRSYKQYLMPHGEAFRVFNRDFIKDEQLLLLFRSLGFNNTKEARLQALKDVKDLFEKLKYSNLDNETIKRLFINSYPSFGIFSCEMLRCIDFEQEHDIQYNTKELRNIIESSKQANVKYHSDIDKLLQNVENAKENTMVLSYAREIHNHLNN